MTESVENNLWGSLRAMEELVMLLRHIGEHVRERNDEATAARIARQAGDVQRRTRLIRQALLQQETPEGPDAQGG